MPEPADDAPVPRLPRGRGIKLSRPALLRIVFTAALLVVVVVIQKPCATGVSNFVNSFDGPAGSGSGSAAPQLPRPGAVDVPAAGSASDYEQLRPDMTEAELKAAIERAKAKAKARE